MITEEEKKEIIAETAKQVKKDLFNAFNNGSRTLLNNLDPDFVVRDIYPQYQEKYGDA